MSTNGGNGTLRPSRFGATSETPCAYLKSADPAAIQKAIEKAEAEKVEETRRLREFVGLDKEPPK